VKEQANTPEQRKTPPGLTPFLLLRPPEELPRHSLGVRRLIAQLVSPDESRESVADALGLYFAAVKGNQAAIVRLLHHSATLIAILEAIAEDNPDVLRPIARKQFVWPALIGSKHFDKNRSLLRHLQVGKKCSIRGKWNPKSRATSMALGMYMWLKMNQDALGLPHLTLETKKQWFETGWSVLCDVTDRHPEKDTFLRQIGQHYGQHSKNTGAQKRVTPRTRESNIRAGIRKQLWQSFRNVTRHAPKSTD